jgi:cyanophycin synthetase
MTSKHIEILSHRVLHGPNMWTYRSVLEVLIDIGELEDYPSNTLPGFVDRLVQWMPSLMEHRCSYDEYGGFVRRLREGTWPGHILEHVTLELQAQAGLPGGFGRAREMNQRGIYKVIVDAWQDDVALASFMGGLDIVMAAIEDRACDIASIVARLRDMVDSLCLGPSTAAIVQAADDRKVPAIRLTDGNLVQLGYGARQRRIWTAETDRTSAIAEGVSRDKDLTKRLLAACGVPVPGGRSVSDAADAWAAAQQIGVPVVVKPCDGNHGRGVFTNLRTREEVEAAYAVAIEQGSGVIVERFIEGNEHRLLVVGDRLVAAARGDIATVVGDGTHSVLELIELQLNSDPRRGRTEDSPLNPVRIDSAARIELQAQGLHPESVPEAGRSVLIQRNGNVAIDVTDTVHPSTARIVTLAARIVGLDIAGIDLVARDIARPLAEQGAAIVEVNAGPGLLMHLKPAQGMPQPVGQAIVEHLFPDGEMGRIPLVGITGSQATAQTARLVARMMRLDGQRVGLACGDGLYVDERRIDATDNAHFEGARKVLVNRTVQAAVLENGLREMAAVGLAYDRCQIGVVTGLQGADLMPDLHIDSAERLWSVARTQVDIVLPEGTAVLNAADPAVVEMARLCDGEVVLFGHSAALPAIVEHRARGARAVYLRGRDVVLASGSGEVVIAGLAAGAGLSAGRPSDVSVAVLAAVATGWSLGVRPELIRAAIEAGEKASTEHLPTEKASGTQMLAPARAASMQPVRISA